MIHILSFFRLMCLLTFHFDTVTASAALTAVIQFVCVSLTNKECQAAKTGIWNIAGNPDRETAFHEHTPRLHQKETQILSSHRATIPIKCGIEESCSEQDSSSTRYWVKHRFASAWCLPKVAQRWTSAAAQSHSRSPWETTVIFLFPVRAKLSKWSY